MPRMSPRLSKLVVQVEVDALPPFMAVPRYLVGVKAETSLSQDPNSYGLNSYVVAFGPGMHCPSHTLVPREVIIGNGTACLVKFNMLVRDDIVVATPPSEPVRSW